MSDSCVLNLLSIWIHGANVVTNRSQSVGVWILQFIVETYENYFRDKWTTYNLSVTIAVTALLKKNVDVITNNQQRIVYELSLLDCYLWCQNIKQSEWNKPIVIIGAR